MCQKLPRAERDRIDQERELHGFLRQSHISPKNMKRLEVLAGGPDPQNAEMAAVLLEVARVKPHTRKRYRFLAREHPALLRRLLEVQGLYVDGPWEGDPEFDPWNDDESVALGAFDYEFGFNEVHPSAGTPGPGAPMAPEDIADQLRFFERWSPVWERG